MSLVAGNDPFCSLAIVPLESYQETSIPVGDYERVPLVSDNMELEFQQIPDSPEITALGAVETLEVGNGLWRGSFRTLQYYNANWFHWMMCQLVGGCEITVPDRMPNGVLLPGGTGDATTHVYIPQSFNCDDVGSESGITWGLSLRLIKGGKDNANNTGWRIGDCHVVGATFEWPDPPNWPTVTWEVIGIIETRLDLVSYTPPSQRAGEYQVKPGDIGIDPSHATLPSMSFAGNPIGIRNIRSASLTVRNGIDFGILPFANKFDKLPATQRVHRAGHESKFTVEGRFSSFVEQTSLDTAAGEVYAQWVNNVFTGDAVRLRAISARDGATADPPQFPLAEVGDDVPYAFDVYLPNASLRDASGPMSTPDTLPLDWTYKGFGGPIPPSNTALTTNYDAPIVFQFMVAHDDPIDGADQPYNTAARGGNPPHSDLLS